MKILLVIAPWKKDEQYGHGMDRVAAVLPPLGILYIAAVLDKEGYNVSIIDGIAENLNHDELKQRMKRFSPDIVGFSCVTPMAIATRISIQTVREVLPEAMIVVGGPHVTALPEESIRSFEADFGIYGEGEYTFLELVRAIENESDYSDIKGLIFREGGEVRFNGPAGRIENLDKIPFPARHLINMKLYRPSPANCRKLPASAILTSRGCPFSCTFCSKSVFGNKFRARSPNNVLEEIDQLVEKYDINDLQIFDDTFMLNRKRVVEICKMLLERDYDLLWNCMSRVNMVDENLLILMKRAGCYQIGFGVESGNQQLLDNIKKGISLDQSRRAIRSTKKVGIETRAFYMLGLPGSTKETIKQTIDFAKELNADISQFMLTTPYPGTELYNDVGKYGKIINDDWNNFVLIPDKPTFVPDGLTEEDLLYYLDLAYKGYYLRLGYLLNSFFKIRSFNDFNRRLKAISAVLFN